MRAIQHWSTDAVEPQHRLAYWIDAICESFLEMGADPSQRASFYGRIGHCRLNRIAATQAQGSPQVVRRDGACIAQSRRNYYYLISQPKLPWGVVHAGREHIVQPGQSVLIDSRLPYEFDFAQGLDDLSVELSIDWLERWIADPAALLGRPIAAQDGWGLALRGLKEALVPQATAGLPLPDELVEDQLGVLLSMAAGEQPVASPSSRSVYRRCVAALREHLGHPGVCAADIAAMCAVSLRTLHRAFAAEKRTFGSVLLQLRVDEAARMLGDRRFARLTIAAIAARCGFVDASHFARSFRRLRGIGPRAHRSGALR